MNLDFAAMQENIDACDAQIAASDAVLGAMDGALALDLGEYDGWAGCTVVVDGKPATFYFQTWDEPARDTVGSLPTAEEMKPAIRSVVQSVAADLIKLPVREMSGHTVEFHRIGDAQPTRVNVPAGLTRIATDGERNGRMAWVPGA